MSLRAASNPPAFVDDGDWKKKEEEEEEKEGEVEEEEEDGDEEEKCTRLLRSPPDLRAKKTDSGAQCC